MPVPCMTLVPRGPQPGLARASLNRLAVARPSPGRRAQRQTDRTAGGRPAVTSAAPSPDGGTREGAR